VGRIGRVLADPAVEEPLLVFGESPAGARGRHLLGGIGRVDAFEHPAGGGLARHDRAGFDRRLPDVEPEVGLPPGGVLAVAVEAVLGQDRPDLAIEVEGTLGPSRPEDEQRAGQAAERHQAAGRSACGG
jgi:hypothetical protein